MSIRKFVYLDFRQLKRSNIRSKSSNYRKFIVTFNNWKKMLCSAIYKFWNSHGTKFNSRLILLFFRHESASFRLRRSRNFVSLCHSQQSFLLRRLFHWIVSITRIHDFNNLQSVMAFASKSGETGKCSGKLQVIIFAEL